MAHMSLKRTTHIPNHLIDHLLPYLTLAELRIILIIIRQTNGWIDARTGKRKTRDRISHRQFVSKSGLTRQTVSSTLNRLNQRGIILITDKTGAPLYTPDMRKGRTWLFYAVSTLEDVGLVNGRCKGRTPEHVGIVVHNKTNLTKEKRTKGVRSIGSILREWFDR